MMKETTAGQSHTRTLLIFLTLAFLLASPVQAAFTLQAEANPDPVESGQIVFVRAVVSSTSLTGDLTLRMLWPAELNNSPYVTGGGACSGGCAGGKYLAWNLGILGASGSISVGFNEVVDGSLADGTVIPFEFELLEDDSLVDTLSLAVEVQSQSPLALAVDPLTDPVAPGATLVYEIVYGNDALVSAENTELVFPIPAGASFASATGGGVFAAGEVSWNRGSLGALDGGRERVTVQVDSLAEGSLLLVDAATLSGDVSSLPRMAEAMAVSRVATEGLQLELETNPGPVEPGQLSDTQITVSNPGDSDTGTLTLRMTMPESLGTSPYTSGGGGCSGGCFSGNFVIWNLGILGPNTSVTLSVNENLNAGADSGSLMPLEIELLEGGIPVRHRSHTQIVQEASPLEVMVDAMTDPVAPGGILVYEIVYGNAGGVSSENSELVFPLPVGASFVSATGGGVLTGSEVHWNLGSLSANSGARERVTVQVDALAEGSLLLVDAASLTGDLSFVAKQAHAMAVSRVATELLQLQLEINPDPVEPGQMADTQITVSNPGDISSGTLVLRMMMPEAMGTSPYFTGGGGCPGGCFTGNFAVWNLGILGANTSVTLNVNENLGAGVLSGSLMPVEVELLEGSLATRNLSHTQIVQESSPLELAVDPLTDPVEPGASLVYEIVYGNAGADSSENSELVFQLPEGAGFVSATGGGVFNAGEVHWNLGSLGANSGGRERVTVLIDALAEGSLLKVDAATLSGTVGFLPKRALAMAVSRVALEPLQLEIEANPDPVEPGQVADTQITISNQGASPTGTLTLRMLMPEELGTSPYTTGGGGCSGGCFTGNFMVWNLGILGTNSAVTVNVNENLVSSLVSGSLMPLEVELLEGSLSARNRSHTQVVQDDSPLELAVDPLADPVAPGGTLVYEIVYGNPGDQSSQNSELVFPLPAGASFVSASGGGVSEAGEVKWNLGSIAPHSGGRERVTVQVDASADGSLLVVDAATLSGDIGFIPRHARAMAVSRVATELLQLELTATPNPVAVGGIIDTELTITNPTGSPSGTLTLKVVWPEELNGSPVITGGGGCSGGCFTGNFLSWNLGILGPTGSVTVGFNENLRNSFPEGSLVPLEIELSEGSLASRNASKTVLIHPFTDHDEDGEADIFDDDDDNDGIPDWWEILYGLDPFNDEDADDDPDEDGLTNLEEYLAGTNPNVNEDIILKDGFEPTNSDTDSETTPK